MKNMTLIIAVLVSIAACSEGQDDNSTVGLLSVDCQQRKFTFEVTKQKGILSYNIKLKAYAVTFLPPSTIDSRAVGLICTGDPKKLRQLFGDVKFSGRLKEVNQDITPVLGTDYYYLELNSISSL